MRLEYILEGNQFYKDTKILLFAIRAKSNLIFV